jgi:hypothetical protein
MKTKLSLVLAVASALSAPASFSQQETPLPPPVPPNAGEPRPPTPPDAAPDRPRGERRPDGDRPPGGGGRERGRPEGDRGHGPDLERDSGRPDGGRRADGPRGEGSRRQEGPGERGGERISKPTPYIGVMSAPVPPPLATQLGLQEGFGVVVEEVVPESPAAAAGLQRFDVLRMLDDQRLVDPNHLAVLIRSYGKDKELTFTLLRKGAEQKVTLKIGERMLPERRSAGPMGPMGGEFGQRMERFRDQTQEHAKRLQETLRGLQERMREFQERFEQWRKNPEAGAPPEPPKLENLGEPEGPRRRMEPPQPRDLLREVRPGGAPQVTVDGDGTVTTWNTAQARVVVKDASGEVTVRAEDGHRTVEAKDATGATIFSGPVDTEEQRKALPENVRKSLEKIQAHPPRGERPPGPEGESREKGPRPEPPSGGAPGPREVQ